MCCVRYGDFAYFGGLGYFSSFIRYDILILNPERSPSFPLSRVSSVLPVPAGVFQVSSSSRTAKIRRSLRLFLPQSSYYFSYLHVKVQIPLIKPNYLLEPTTKEQCQIIKIPSSNAIRPNTAAYFYFWVSQLYGGMTLEFRLTYQYRPNRLPRRLLFKWYRQQCPYQIV